MSRCFHSEALARVRRCLWVGVVAALSLASVREVRHGLMTCFVEGVKVSSNNQFV